MPGGRGVRSGKQDAQRGGDCRGGVLKSGLKRVYSAEQLAARVAELGREISKDYGDRTVDVVVMLENAFVFGADLVRKFSGQVVCHFVRAEIRDIEFGGHDRREIYFSTPAAPGRAGRAGGGCGDAVGAHAGFFDEAVAGKPAPLAAPGGSVRQAG